MYKAVLVTAAFPPLSWTFVLVGGRATPCLSIETPKEAGKNGFNHIFRKSLPALNTLLLGCGVVRCTHKAAPGWGLGNHMPGSCFVFSSADPMALQWVIEDISCSVRTGLENPGQQILSSKDKVFCLNWRQTTVGSTSMEPFGSVVQEPPSWKGRRGSILGGRKEELFGKYLVLANASAFSPSPPLRCSEP